MNYESNDLHRETPLSDADTSARSADKHKQHHSSLLVKRQKSSSSNDEMKNHRSSLERRSGQQSKITTNLSTEETDVTPLNFGSSNKQRESGNVN